MTYDDTSYEEIKRMEELGRRLRAEADSRAAAPKVRSRAEMEAASAAGHEIVDAEWCVGVTCDECGPLTLDRAMLTADAEIWLHEHYVDEHVRWGHGKTEPGKPPVDN